MKVLSLFDGMACGALALMKAGITIESYDAFEIDDYAARTALHNFPFIKQHGDVFKADFSQFKGVDLLCGGSPCTYWSIAQKNNRETEASGMGWELFSQYVRALHEAKPKFFVYENNKSMSKAIRTSIDETFGFEAIGINSALVSAQNRQRLYWVGKLNDDGTYSKVNIEQPEDRGILLWNILEGANEESVACRCRGRVGKDGIPFAKYECREDGKANTLDTNTTNGAMVAEPVCSDGCKGKILVAETVRVGALPRPNGELSTSQAFRVYSTEGKSVNLTAGGGGAGGKTGLYAIPCKLDEHGTVIKAVSCADGKTYTVYEVKDGRITIKGKQYPIKLVDGCYIIRKLSVRECMRLQTVPEWYEFPVSDSQAYKMLGNGWTVELIAHILASLK